MKIPALTDLAQDVKRIADALTTIAEVAQELVNQQGFKGTRKEMVPVNALDLIEVVSPSLMKERND